MNLIIPQFPNTTTDPFIVTSPQTTSYNCIAWAFGDNTKWYWPDPEEMYFWPNNVSRTVDVNSFIELYKLIGYEICEEHILEKSYEKIAIFLDSHGFPTHAARQLSNGFWTSKLGCEFDIQHTIQSMSNSVYGNARVYMSRLSI
jgi:hypothetical protein